MIFVHFWKLTTKIMSKETYNKVLEKLQKLDEYLRYLKDIQKTNKNSFLADYHFFGLAERFLQLSIEILLDVGKMIITVKNLKKPEDNQDLFSVLHDSDVISESLTAKLVGVANFRNILVHDYEKIDREIVYEKLQNNLDDFENFKKEIIRYINKQK